MMNTPNLTPANLPDNQILIDPNHQGIVINFQMIRYWNGQFNITMPDLAAYPGSQQWLGKALLAVSNNLLNPPMIATQLE